MRTSIDRIQGQAYALSLFASIQGCSHNLFKISGAHTILENLEVSVKYHKGEYAAGINDVLEGARKALNAEAGDE